MTDNEIIRCLRLCRAGDCENCKALNVCDATFSFHKDALDLINLQKAEIERLTDLSDRLGNDIDIKLNYIYDLEEKIETVKSEAIKEFAERFAKALSEFDMSSVGLPDYDRGYKDCMTAIEDTIDSLVKMTEVEE